MKEHTYRTTNRRTCSVCGRPPVAELSLTDDAGRPLGYTVATHPLIVPDDIPIGGAA